MTTVVAMEFVRGKPVYLRWLVAAQLPALAGAMVPLACVALAAANGPARGGGVLTAAFVVAETVAAAPAGRLLDRVGVRCGLRVCLAGGAVAFGLAAVPGLAVVAMVLAGACLAGVSGGFRALLASVVVVTGRVLALHAVLLDLVLIAGPLVVTGVLALGGASGAAAVLAVVAAVGAVLVPGVDGARPRSASAAARGALSVRASARSLPRLVGAAARGVPPLFRADARRVPPLVRASARTGPRLAGAVARGALPVRAMVPWLACAATVGAGCSVVEVGGYVLLGSAGLGAAAVGTLCGASIVGGVLYGWRGGTGAGRWLVTFGCGAVALAAVPAPAGVFAAAALCGIGTGPLVAVVGARVQGVLPVDRRAEGFALLTTVQGAAFAVGSAAVTVLPAGALPLVGLVPVVAAAVAVGGGRGVRVGLNGRGGSTRYHGGADQFPTMESYVAKVVVEVMPKPEILDPQGQAVAKALPRMGFSGIGEVRQGKRFELEVADSVDDATLHRIAEGFLANTVIEDFVVHREGAR